MTDKLSNQMYFWIGAKHGKSILLMALALIVIVTLLGILLVLSTM